MLRDVLQDLRGDLGQFNEELNECREDNNDGLNELEQDVHSGVDEIRECRAQRDHRRLPFGRREYLLPDR